MALIGVTHQYRIRFAAGMGPGGEEAATFAAATFVTSGDFVDFYENAILDSSGGSFPAGDIVRRVRAEAIIEVVRQDVPTT